MLEALFNPRSLAVIGASSDPFKVGYAILNNITRFGFSGPVFPVNPKSGEILGLKTYPSIPHIPSAVDLAVIAIPAPSVPQALRDCIAKGVKTAVIISAGFKEAGSGGVLLEQEIKSLVRESGMKVLGPNCLGIINTACNLNATFAAGMLPKGKLAFFSQSGALGIAILDWAIGNKVGFSKFISLGNKADLNETDFIEYFMNDPDTDIILGYIEDVVQGKRFLDVARKTTKIKPVILVKSGGTQAGARAASSHTGALAGSENAFTAAFRQTGIMRAEGIEDLFETAMAFYSMKLPQENDLLILTNAGGPGIIAADTAEKLDIHLPQPSRETVQRLSSLLPKNASLYNPVDIIGDATAERYGTVLDHILEEPTLSGFLVILTPQATINPEETARIIIHAAARTSKPLITSFMGEERVRSAIDLLKASSIPNYSYPEPAVRAFRKLHDYAVWAKKPASQPAEVLADRSAVASILLAAKEQNRSRLTENEAREILTCYGFLFPKKLISRTAKEAAAAALAIGYPVVMKIASPDILHKTDVGGVKLGISSRKEAVEAFTVLTSNARRFMPSAFIEGVAVYETIPEGKEVILGITYDRTFGHMIMFGLGGIYVEVLKDVSFRIAPVAPDEAEDMIREIKTYQLLQGARGEKPVDIGTVINSISRLSRLAADFPVIQELDINPLVVFEKSAASLDARIIIGSDPAGGK